ncbi:MAG: hypothetical protein R3C59_30625 [Planctomycetaceae bacterium]
MLANSKSWRDERQNGGEDAGDSPEIYVTGGRFSNVGWLESV